MVPIPNLHGDEYSPFKPNYSRVNPTNSQSLPLPTMGFEYVNDLPPICHGPFRLMVGIMAHLIVSDLLILSL